MGGDWGYVTIPIRSNDRDKTKWEEFFKNCRTLHLIPIIRLSTYVYNDTWVTPNSYDLVDFANFLSELPWPTKNRYVIIFNEPNHGKEWGGKVDPSHYATLLIQAKDIFKARSEDFFLLTAGLDMSVPTSKSSLDALRFYKEMTKSQSSWINSVDGYTFHSYPNPAFSAPVTSNSRFGLKSYKLELNYLNTLTTDSKPFFITETGTIIQNSHFFPTAVSDIWTESHLVGITPFLLFAGDGQFKAFSLLDTHHSPTPNYTSLATLSKTSASPLLNSIIYPGPKSTISSQSLPPGPVYSYVDRMQKIFASHPPTLIIGKNKITIDVVDNFFSRAKGLSGRESLPPDHGMLFVFSFPQPQSFWMHDMKFDLDIIWISKGKVVEITENVPSPSKTNNVPKIVTPKVLADQVLEVPAGFAASHGIKVGDEVDFRP